ncbi:MAG: P-loop NTPase [Bdellovibrionales bacterium]|nr:P-loop NTPase [Bdellovibrionales bacterium]
MKELPNIHNQTTLQPKKQPSFGAENLSRIKYIVAVSSGKGGVGKSTVSVNLAISLTKLGYKVGLMDADVYGPSVPKMLGGTNPPQEKNGKLMPIEKYGIFYMSMALLTNDDSPVIWRGPMATKLIQHFLMQVEWGELDFLLIDLPPGTGDVQLTLTQGAPLTGAVIVTTPQEVAVSVTMRGIRMFDEVNVPILGIIENMSGFVCPHCNEITDIFKKGGGKKTSEQWGFPFLGEIPLDPKLAYAGDEGKPMILEASDEQVSKIAYQNIAKNLVEQVQKVEVLTKRNQQIPTKIDFENGYVTAEWPDQIQSRIDPRRLRYYCECAMCVDENSGERKIKEDEISPDVHPLGFRQVGRYGVQISWSDGHNTGIYTFERLRDLGEMLV